MSSFSKIRKEYKRLRQRGLTLIEAAVVLGLASLVIAGVMVFYQSASVGAKTTEALGELASLQQGIRTVYAGQSSYTGLTPAALIATRSIPGKMVVSDTELTHAFNGEITIAPHNIGTGTDNGFEITFKDLPSEACARMATMDLGTGLYSMDVTGGNTPENGATSALNPAQAAAACGSGNASQITWRFF